MEALKAVDLYALRWMVHEMGYEVWAFDEENIRADRGGDLGMW